MELNDKTIMVLGAWGLVGQAICRLLLAEGPRRLVACSLSKEECSSLKSGLRALSEANSTEIVTDYGDIFLRDEFAGRPRAEIVRDATSRGLLLEDLFGKVDMALLEQSHLYGLFQKHKPHAIIDCVNTATAFAYQDIYGKVGAVRRYLGESGEEHDNAEELAASVEGMLTALPMPQLIRHMLVLYESLRAAEVHIYLKIGTTGTGGMGFNVPYTHSEEKPSQMLLTKSAIAGAQTQLLFLMGRTPGGPIVKEIKPASTIAWKAISYGPILRGGAPIQMYDCPPENGASLNESSQLPSQNVWTELKGEVLESVYVDQGENGLFSLGEFEAITTTGQMEFITPEDIAEVVLLEIRGVNTGRDVVAALDGSILTPSYRAGVMRAAALEEMRRLQSEHRHESVAFENLGPPRLSKLLYEAYLLKRSRETLRGVAEGAPAALSAGSERLIREDQWLRSAIISIGVPILLSDGKTILRGPTVKSPPPEEAALPATQENVERWAANGWVDLREANMALWRERARRILDEVDSLSGEDTSSFTQRNRRFWVAEEGFAIGKVAGWIFEKEDCAFRLK